ncbi:MAG: hypothetical protein JWP97_5794 [Labilithrix sp.]|nr:hypothetical protein [Labilithrix sp.]
MLPRVRRLVHELVARADRGAADVALARLRAVRGEEGTLVIAPDAEGRPLGELREREAARVVLPAGVYASIPTSEARVRLLELLARAGRETLTLHVVVRDEATHASRALVDAPRRLLRGAGVPLAEPGDRHAGGFVHCFFDDEALLVELARAGLGIVARDGATFVVAATKDDAPLGADPFAVELARVAPLVPLVDRQRRSRSPAEVLAAMRARGRRTTTVRTAVGRARLRRAIGWVDAVTPPGASCFRRILLECALDAGAANETVVFGLDVGRTGHVAFAGREELAFDVAFAIPARDAT